MQLWFNELPFIVSDHGSRRTWGPDPSNSGFGVWKGDLPPLNWGRSATFVHTVFAKIHSWGSRGIPEPPIHTLYLGGGGYWVKKTRNLPAPKDHLLAKFHPYTMVYNESGLIFYREQTHRQTNTHTNIAPYVLDHLGLPGIARDDKNEV